MTHNTKLIIASLLSILFLSFHLTDDIVRGYEPGTLTNLSALPIMVVWLYGAIVLGEKRSGHVIMLIGALLGLGIPIIHFKGAGVAEIATSDGGFFFVWTLIAGGATSLFSVVLAARLLLNPKWGLNQ
jgi:NO-binding membrane sensor protein with MHYT domain